ncbi:uncharacterized protein LOC109281622 [Alligator mississippiensis]|uniref:uncharacterized protein LOC109281622 n=1 Tax=Alligator mississippiensis TaxID=8496 RepID=UPI00287752CF|nr:uncharacterized protein LOC109281622 [Alligator mississippiensis]
MLLSVYACGSVIFDFFPRGVTEGGWSFWLVFGHRHCRGPVPTFWGARINHHKRLSHSSKQQKPNTRTTQLITGCTPTRRGTGHRVWRKHRGQRGTLTEEFTVSLRCKDTKQQVENYEHSFLSEYRRRLLAFEIEMLQMGAGNLVVQLDQHGYNQHLQNMEDIEVCCFEMETSQHEAIPSRRTQNNNGLSQG